MHWEEPTCRVCGCLESRACPGGCYWVDENQDLCSECLEIVATLAVEFGVDDRSPAAIVAIGYGLAAERSFGPPHQEELWETIRLGNDEKEYLALSTPADDLLERIFTAFRLPGEGH